MAILKQMGAGPHHDWAVRGTEIRIGSVTVDAAAHQGEGDTIVDVYVKPDGSYALQGPGAFAANITIRGRSYREEPGADNQGHPGMARIPEPLDANAVEITLWSKP
ncbi:hypothetical protein D5041_01995 [Verminephrobacter aporrectodeae subsp. tuberculatae]|uniref:hypothetical protein n=1 Tax=Verminephrobacter aporrectodeae TaxID=1110389 RepID=UPI00223903BF|nr:hypothetical protein [Verminephrobacter aporrectodeae]MCW5222410.1 hypothetical protein [Verminephrobacter aporrectodeae subsp. tuberculatae]MCW5287874.1 hypothetical protein [Verminephrobacter aporrectodeae subsp. tuberculatae]